ncbi:MAG: ribosome-associated translation inhibitor RaiA [Acidobacteriia bacterium]|nr:ribosome-associated translation inhibitor RaiA [Terriglobia bacterium]
MKIHYTGKLETISPALEKKLAARYAKLAKLLDGRSEKEAHVILAAERYSKRAEITVNYFDHSMVGTGSASDSFTALIAALDKLERQVIRQRTKWRDTKRASGPEMKSKALQAVATPAEPLGPRVFPLNGGKLKPMSAGEALLRIGAKKDYLVYRDLETERVSVLLRRADGNFDLVDT